MIKSIKSFMFMWWSVLLYTIGITIIDTPGTGDTEGRDCEHGTLMELLKKQQWSDKYFDNFLIGIALAKGIKEIGSVDAFIIMFKVREAFGEKKTKLNYLLKFSELSLFVREQILAFHNQCRTKYIYTLIFLERRCLETL